MALFNISNFLSSPSSITQGAQRTLGTVTSTVNTIRNSGAALSSAIQNPTAFLKNRLGAAIPPGAQTILGGNALVNTTPTANNDWRVSLSLPPGSYMQSPMLTPLLETDSKLIFPFTPRISVAHKANYNDLAPVHNNYPFLAYSGSRVESINIDAPFLIEDSKEGAYWIAALHYFRSVSKMYYGSGESQGAPPPVVKLNGYGNHVFNNVPVVIENFRIDMPDDCDYISAELAGQTSRIPVKSTFTIECKPIYSREQVRNFSLSEFVTGGYLTSGKGGFI